MASSSTPNEGRAIGFARVARALGAETRRAGFDVPSFRSPPHVDGVRRTVRRRPDGSVVVSVVIHGRPWAAVVADMIDGIVLGAGRPGAPLSAGEADALRSALWGAADTFLDELPAPASPPGSTETPGRPGDLAG